MANRGVDQHPSTILNLKDPAVETVYLAIRKYVDLLDRFSISSASLVVKSLEHAIKTGHEFSDIEQLKLDRYMKNHGKANGRNKLLRLLGIQ